MEITFRDLLTAIHGMGFGAVFILGFPLAIVELARMSAAPNTGVSVAGIREERLFARYLWVLAAIGWAAVLIGAYVIYPWYRAKLPPPPFNLADYPRNLLLSSPSTSGWHDIGMEWKEHVAWIAPIAITMLASVFTSYGAQLAHHRELRRSLLIFTVVAFAAAGAAGFFGAFLNKFAPVRGGPVIHIIAGEAN